MFVSLVIAAGLLAPQEPVVAPELAELLELVCVDCHGGREPERGLDLAPGPALTEVLAGPRARAALRAVETGFMPPASAGGLDAETRAELVAALRASLPPAPPSSAARMRRLNRREFDACIEAMLGVRYDSTATFPADAAAHGFDNVGDVMFLNDVLVEKYVDAATEVLDLLFADPDHGKRLGWGSPADDRDVLWRLMRRAFRRQPSEDEVAERMALVDPNAAGTERLRLPLLATLLSPAFLFRVETDHAEATPQPLGPYELATRLAFLVEGRGPDERLLELAADGQILQDDVLASELDRLLDLPRNRSLGEAFGAQWLGVQDVRDHAVDFRVYRNFNGSLRYSMHAEVVQFLMELLRTGAPLTDVIAADWTFVNARLADHYGMSGVKGRDLQRVTITDPARGGVLGMAAVLTVTSHPDRTSPVLRGAWILDTLLGDPPPPPPDDAGMLPPEKKKNKESGVGPTVRERLELHRAAPACADCHARIDPLGFALEGFDGVGRAREDEKGKPVDQRGVLPDGREVEGVAALKEVLLEKPERLALALSKALVAYGVGRSPEAGDEAALEEVVRACGAADWDSRVLLHAFVRSGVFRSRGVSVR